MTITWAGALADYTTAMTAARRSPGTIRLHRHYIRNFAATTRRGPWMVTRSDLRAFLARPRWSAETAKSARGALRGFYGWAYDEGLVDVDPTAKLAPVRVVPGVVRPAPDPMVARALGVAAERERLMILLAAYDGLRVGEICRIHRDDWTPPLLLVHGKGGKERIVPVTNPELVSALDRTEGFLFPGGIDGHLAPGSVGHLVSDLLPDSWSAHRLRTRFATRSYARNPDLIALGKVMGHSRPETTLRYVLLEDDAATRVVLAAA